jgi:hypothetical protein
MSASEVSDTCAKIKFCHLPSAVNTVLQKRTFEEISLPAIMTREGNNGILLLYIMLFVCPLIGDSVLEFQI